MTSKEQMDSEPAGPPAYDAIYDRFHHKVRQYGDDLISFVSEELGSPPPGISITLQRYELPPSVFHWAWEVGSPDSATEQAVLRFFQTDAGKRALACDGSDGVEFKLASIQLRIPTSHGDDPQEQLPAGLTAAFTPLQEGQEVTIVFGASTHGVCLSAATAGWLQVAPRMHFSDVLVLQFQGQDSMYLHQTELRDID
jgi:hypothetical protein